MPFQLESHNINSFLCLENFKLLNQNDSPELPRLNKFNQLPTYIMPGKCWPLLFYTELVFVSNFVMGHFFFFDFISLYNTLLQYLYLYK